MSSDIVIATGQRNLISAAPATVPVKPSNTHPSADANDAFIMTSSFGLGYFVRPSPPAAGKRVRLRLGGEPRGEETARHGAEERPPVHHSIT
jgi:hypothetical protein